MIHACDATRYVSAYIIIDHKKDKWKVKIN